MRTVFFGTPAIAVPALRALHASTELAAVVCQPDRPSGRGLRLTAPAVKTVAAELGVPVHQPERVRDGELAAWLRTLDPAFALVMAYGRILPAEVLATTPRGFLNLHASLLPRYRGAAPIQWAVIRGETQTGISLMQMDEGMDTGPVFSRRALEIGPEETAGELAVRLAELAARVVREELPLAVAGAISALPQDDALASYAPPITREAACIDWSKPAAEVRDFVRGMTPAPGAFTRHRERILKVMTVSLAAETRPGAPGTLVVEGRRVFITTGEGTVELLAAKCEGRCTQCAADLVNGRAFTPGDRLGV